MLTKEDIIILDKTQVKTAGEVLGRALQDDPVSAYDIPDKCTFITFLSYSIYLQNNRYFPAPVPPLMYSLTNI